MNEKTADVIIEAISTLKENIHLPDGTTYDEIKNIIRIFMRQHPEVFWFSHQYQYDEQTSMLKFRYNFTSEKQTFFAKEIEKAVSTLFQPHLLQHLSETDKVLYVYKWIVSNTTYNEYSSFNQTIYSVLINRSSVCTGYAKTAQYLLGILGIESRLVFGKFRSDSSEDGRHVWNIVRIDGEWYHVDFCMGDPALMHLIGDTDLPVERDGLLWNYFCVSTERILRNRSIEFPETYPQCDKTLNYTSQTILNQPERQLAVCKSDSGSSAKIYLDSFDKYSVIKVARNDHSLICNEADILNKLKGCPHIILNKGIIGNGIVLEQLTPWSELLQSHYYHLDELRLSDILRQLAEGLIECRDNEITYSDIHYNNIFVTQDGTYKWGDFGFAYQSTPDGSMPDQMIGKDGIALGSRWFMAPETYHNRIFTESSAVYSLAMIAYFIINDLQPPLLERVTDPEDAIVMRMNGDPLELPANAYLYRSIAAEIFMILNAGVSERTKTLEDFIRAISVSPTTGRVQSDIAVPDYDPDIFARTMGQFCASMAADNEENDNITGIQPIIEFGNIPDPALYAHELDLDLFDDTLYEVGDVGETDCEDIPADIDISSGVPVSDISSEDTSRINACVYAPAEIRPRKSFIIRVYMYRSDETEAVDAKINEIDPLAVKKEYKPLDIPVKEGDRLSVQLCLSEGVECKEMTKTIIWHNHYADCSFMAKLTDSSQETVDGTAYVFVNGVPAGEMLLTIDVVESLPRNNYAQVDTHRFSRIFISYAHQDETQVRGIAEGCRMLGKDYFFDRHTLHPGDIFKDKILNYIESADLFVLCWSKNAAESEWVQIERTHALQLIKDGRSRLTLYPLSITPEAPLPPDMSDKYNFGTL